MGFNLRKNSEEKILDRIIENFRQRQLYIEHKDGLNMYMIKKEQDKVRKDEIFQAILNLDRSL